MALYFYLNETTGDLVYSNQASYSAEGYTALGEQTDMSPSQSSEWVFHSKRNIIKSVTKDPAVTGKIAGLTSMCNMFYLCRSLAFLDLSGFDTSQVTNMSYMFNNCSALTSLDLSSLDTSQVTNMQSMFSVCRSLASLDLSSLDTSRVTNMGSMFSSCSGLTSLDLSSLDTSQVTEMFNMFDGCSSLISLDLSGFDTSQVIGQSNMFLDCSSLRILAISGSMSNVLFRLPASQYYPAAGGAAVARTDLTAGTWIRDLGDRGLLTSLAQQSSAFKALSDRLGRLEVKVLGSSQAPSYGTSAPGDKLTSIVAQAQAVMSIRRRITALAKQAAKAQ